MVLQQALFSLAIGLGAINAISAKYELIDSGRLALDSPQAKANIKYLTDYIKNQPPPRVDTRMFPGFISAPCYYIRRPFNTTVDGIKIDILATEDLPDTITASGEATVDITTSTAKVDSSSASWRIESSRADRFQTSASVNIAGFGGSVVFEQNRGSLDENGASTGWQQEYREEVCKTYQCPPYTICSVQTWTYIAKMTGICPLVPIVDPVCFVERSGIDATAYPAYKVFRKKGFLHGNFSLPSIHMQPRPWKDLGYSLYKISKKNGKRVGKVLPSLFNDGVWWPSKAKYNVEYSIQSPCSLVTPLYLADGRPKRSQVVIERSFDRNGSMLIRRLGAIETHVNSIRVTILKNDLD